MREIRTSGSEGGAAQSNASSLPLSLASPGRLTHRNHRYALIDSAPREISGLLPGIGECFFFESINDLGKGLQNALYVLFRVRRRYVELRVAFQNTVLQE